MVTLQEHRSERVSTGWITAAFWAAVAWSGYLLIGASPWWHWVLSTAVGAALTVAWWRERRRSRYWHLFGFTCAVVAALALSGSATAIFASYSVPADSVGQTETVCGSVVNPVPADELRVTVVASGEPVVTSRPIPRSELERVCSDNRRYRIRDATGLALVGLLFAARSAGHVLPRRSRAGCVPVTPSSGPTRSTSVTA